MINTTTDSCTTDWTDRYEILRESVQSGYGGDGLAMALEYGVLRWLEGSNSIPQLPSLPQALPNSPSSRSEAALILANLTDRRFI